MTSTAAIHKKVNFPYSLELLCMVIGLTACVSAMAAETPQGGGSDQKTNLTVVTTAAHCDWQWGHSRAWHEER